MKVKTRKELDQERCVHGCDDHPLVLMAVCCRSSTVIAWYNRENGHLILMCANCGKSTMTVQVAA